MTDRPKSQVAIAHPYQAGSHEASLVKFRSVVKEEIACRTNKETDRGTDRRTEK